MELLGSKASRVVEKSVNSVSAFGAKSFVHFLSPPFPTEPATLGFGGDPFREVVSARTPEGLMQRRGSSCAKSGYSRTNLPLLSGQRPPGAISFVSRRKIWKKGVPKNASFFGISEFQNGVPAEAQPSGGFGGERRSSGVSELFALGRKRGIRSLRRRSANAFALTYRFPAPSHWCLARILTSGGVPERCPICLQKSSAGQPL